MIEQLSFTVRFPPTDHYPLGRAFDRSLDFSKGMTAITGPNEVGKTLVLEMIEFLLFGVTALRGAATDYKHLKATGVVSIRGTRYRIERTARNAALTYAEGGDEACTLAVGTKPVNQRILKILGYGLDVFRVANVANQGDAERLSKMKPTERKAMVDKLIGADQIESIASWCGDQALGVAREIAGLEQGLGAEPVEPVKPEGYHPAAELSELVLQLRDATDAAVRAEAFLANPPAVAELGPEPTRVPLSTLDRADQILGLRTYDFDLAAAERARDAYDRWLMRQAFERSHPRPTLTREELEGENHRLYLQRDLTRLKKSPVLTCPCGKPFTTADAEIARIEAELAEIPVLKGIYDLAQEANRLDDWDRVATKQAWDGFKDVPEAKPPHHNPADAKGAIHVSEVAKALSELGLTGMTREAIRALAAELRAWEAQRAAYAAALARREAWDIQANSVRQTLEAARLVAAPGRLEAAQALLTAVQIYEAAKATYDASFTSWTAGRDRLADLRREEASWRNGKAAMNEVRQETKTYLAPALSRVASYMLAQMTGGQRGRIVVDEDFEIEVDGQALNTLSGSGKVCANLAVRLGLGRILTNGVFPVFAGDEMDASMDGDRASHLHNALSALEGKLTQILIITHKQPATPRVIKLEN